MKVSVLSFDSNLQTVQRHTPSLLTILLDTSTSIEEKASVNILQSRQGSQAEGQRWWRWWWWRRIFSDTTLYCTASLNPYNTQIPGPGPHFSLTERFSGHHRHFVYLSFKINNYNNAILNMNKRLALSFLTLYWRKRCSNVASSFIK